VPSLVLPARDVLSATPRTRILRLALDGRPFPFLAGQAVLAGLPGGSVKKPYSIASPPGDAARNGTIELLVQVEDADTADPHLERVTPGMAVEITGPFGSFVLPDPLPERDLLFVAGGTGIAPLRSIMWDAFEREIVDRVSVVYSARSPEEFAYERELRELAEAGRIELYLTVTRETGQTWGGLRGRVDRHLLANALHGPETRCFLCGPPALVADATDWLYEAGIDPHRILTERY
jgi:NAD(P)H-flavin reductase